MAITDINQVEEPQLEYGKEYTYADYLTWQFDEMVELIKGKIYRMSPAPGTRHQVVCSNLYILINQYLKNKSCHVFFAPWDVVLSIADKKERKQLRLCNLISVSFVIQRSLKSVDVLEPPIG